MKKLQLFIILLVTTSFSATGQDLISGGSNSWVFHTPDDGRTTMYFAPLNNGIWDWARGGEFRNDGSQNPETFVTYGRLRSKHENGGLWLSNANLGFIGKHNNNVGIWTQGIGWNTFNVNINTGSIAIGRTTAPSGFKLAVQGKMIIEEIQLQQSDFWPDYVFDKDYSLIPLEELETFIRENGHLPNIPSAEEVAAEKGFKTAEMIQKLLEKVEELTLYTIAQQKDFLREKQNLEQKIDLLEQSINTLKNK